MSNTVFPSFPGLAWGTSRKPTWRSRVQKSVSGRRIGIEYMSYPLYTWTVSIAVLRQYSSLGELAQLQGFFNSMRGMVDTFLFADPDDYVIPTGQAIGTGNSANKKFQCVRAYGGYVEPVWAPDAGLVVKVDGVTKTLTTDYSIDDMGMITFVTAPANGKVVTISGTFKFRVYFSQDTLELVNDYADIWKASKFSFESYKP